MLRVTVDEVALVLPLFRGKGVWRSEDKVESALRIFLQRFD